MVGKGLRITLELECLIKQNNITSTTCINFELVLYYR